MYQGLQARESLVIQYLWGLKCAYACVGWGEGIILGGGCVSGWTLRIRIRLITKNLASKLFKCFKKIMAEFVTHGSGENSNYIFPSV